MGVLTTFDAALSRPDKTSLPGSRDRGDGLLVYKGEAGCLEVPGLDRVGVYACCCRDVFLADIGCPDNGITGGVMVSSPDTAKSVMSEPLPKRMKGKNGE